MSQFLGTHQNRLDAKGRVSIPAQFRTVLRAGTNGEAGTSLVLGSWYGVLSELILLILLAKRAMLEESALRAELPGYAAYMAQVKYRLIPRIW